jgi:acyl-CoA thioesterase FadM
MLSTFTTTFDVRGYELGDDGRIGHVVFLQWFEEAAIRASASAGYGMAEYDAIHGAWVMRDMDVEFVASPRYGEQVEIQTWVSDFRRVRSHREYHARRLGDGAPLAHGRAEWVFIDTKTLMPKSLPPDMIARFEANGIPALEPIAWPSGPEEQKVGSWQATRGVQFYEIDQMHHVNNAVYLGWIEQQARQAWSAWNQDHAALGFRRHHIQYRQAAQYGDELHLVSDAAHSGEAIIWHHQVLRGDQLLVEARSIS